MDRVFQWDDGVSELFEGRNDQNEMYWNMPEHLISLWNIIWFQTQPSSFHFISHPDTFLFLPLTVCLPSSMTGCRLGLTYDSSLTPGHSKCPADSFAIISQFVLLVMPGTFGRQVHVKKAQRSSGASQVKDDRQRVSFIQPSSSTCLAELNSRYRHSGTSPKLIADLLTTLQSEELWPERHSRTGGKHG